jgi:hypothetical protein
MNESYWKKKLSDGSFELGTDSMIQNRTASWTKGRQDIIHVTLFFAGKIVEVNCSSKDRNLGHWQQYDNFVFRPSVGTSTRVSRELRCMTTWRCVSLDRPLNNRYIFTLNDYNGCLSEEKKDHCLVCSIKIDGKVNYTWS